MTGAAADVFDFSVKALDGSPMPLADFRGQVLLIVNTASQCGFTPQYAGLQKLHDQFSPRGFSVLGFPCNQFGAQEPGAADDIASFCSHNFGVSFPLGEKIQVNGKQAHPLYRHLTANARGVLGTESVKWNFTKFLINRDGHVVARFAPTTRPEALAADIEALL